MGCKGIGLILHLAPHVKQGEFLEPHSALGFLPMKNIMTDLMSTDHLNCNVIHVGVQQNMSLLMLVTIHSQQLLKSINLVYINADLTGDSQGIPRSTAPYKFIRFMIDRFCLLQHRRSTPKSTKVSLHHKSYMGHCPIIRIF